MSVTDHTGIKDYLGRTHTQQAADNQRNITDLENRLLLLLGENE
jgi:hypothetical protein